MDLKKLLHIVAFLLVVVGGVNWLLVAFGFNLVALVFGPILPVLEKVVYVLVGLSAVYLLVVHRSECKVCGGK